MTIGEPNTVDWPERIDCGPLMSASRCRESGDGDLRLVWVLGEQADRARLEFGSPTDGLAGPGSVTVVCGPPEDGQLGCLSVRDEGLLGSRAAVYVGRPDGG